MRFWTCNRCGHRIDVKADGYFSPWPCLCGAKDVTGVLLEPYKLPPAEPLVEPDVATYLERWFRA